jgi:hypothetical protein
MKRFREYIRERHRELPDEAMRSDADFAGSLTLERVMREELSLHPVNESPTLNHFEALNRRAIARPGRSVTALRDLIHHRPRSRLVLITVNFDTLIEDGMPLDIYSAADDFKRFPEQFTRYINNHLDTSIPLLKLHGTIDNRSTINTSVEDTSSLAESKTEALRHIIRQMSNPRWIYVGYSMRDLDVTDFLRLEEVGSRITEWWVSPFVNDVCRRFGQRRWTKDPTTFETRTIDAPSDAFFGALLRMVREGE